MDFIGKFHVEKKDGIPFQLVYHNPKYQFIPQTQSPITSGEQVSDDHHFQPFFLCPNARSFHKTSFSIVPLFSSPEYVFSSTKTQKDDDHHVVPLFQCNNVEWNGCNACSNTEYGTKYYFCAYCDKTFHKECVESPPKIKNPKHPEHSLQLSYIDYGLNKKSLCCVNARIRKLVYHCIICDVSMHPTCAMKSIPFVINQPKRHDHPLSLFPRQNFLVCSICSLLRKSVLTYICIECNFIAHEDCMHFPHIVKISRHQHRISYKTNLESSEWSCGVCRKGIEIDYGAYGCEKCNDYFVHSRCALRRDVWDGEDLEGVLEEDDITKDASPFNVISEGVIHYFLHDHNLHLKDNTLYDDLNKLCQVCVLPIIGAHLYSCRECNFIIHINCAHTPRRVEHGLHPHPLSLKASSGYSSILFYCNACYRDGGGFVYQCPKKDCSYDLDVRCALISEPFYYQGHEHPLYLALDPEIKHLCQICKKICIEKLNCIVCDFIVCFKCSTLPYIARYKHEEHFLRVMFGVKVSEKDLCEVCELNLRDTWATIFYWCNICSTTFHIECLFGEDPYMKPGLHFKVNDEEVQIILSNNLSRPLCDVCNDLCQGKLFKIREYTACSVRCSKLRTRHLYLDNIRKQIRDHAKKLLRAVNFTSLH